MSMWKLRASLAPVDLMALFWIVHDIDGERAVMIREDTAMIFARLKAAIDGVGGPSRPMLDAATMP